MNNRFYSLCRQTVTVYHPSGDGFGRVVYSRAYFELKRSRSLSFHRGQTQSRVGAREEGSFLLVIPGGIQTVFPGDKVILGKGPAIKTAQEWAAFIPSLVPGLAVVTWAEPKFWNGKIVHTEAGG